MAILDIARAADLRPGEVRFLLEDEPVDFEEMVIGVREGLRGKVEYCPADQDLVLAQVYKAIGRTQ